MNSYLLDPEPFVLNGEVRPRYKRAQRNGTWVDTTDHYLDRSTGFPIWQLGVEWSGSDGRGGYVSQRGYIEVPAPSEPEVTAGTPAKVLQGLELVTEFKRWDVLRAAAVS